MGDSYLQDVTGSERLSLDEECAPNRLPALVKCNILRMYAMQQQWRDDACKCTFILQVPPLSIVEIRLTIACSTAFTFLRRHPTCVRCVTDANTAALHSKQTVNCSVQVCDAEVMIGDVRRPPPPNYQNCRVGLHPPCRPCACASNLHICSPPHLTRRPAASCSPPLLPPLLHAQAHRQMSAVMGQDERRSSTSCALALACSSPPTAPLLSASAHTVALLDKTGLRLLMNAGRGGGVLQLRV